MTISMHGASVPVFVKALTNLAALLEKGKAHAEAKKFDGAVFVTSRLFPDMLPLSAQVQIACDIAKGGCARLAQVEAPAFADDEKTLDELIERCRKTVAFLETLKPEQIDGSEGRTVTWKTRSGERSMLGQPYLLSHVTPNVYFHVTTTYTMLRQGGVEIGKMDFLGKPS